MEENNSTIIKLGAGDMKEDEYKEISFNACKMSKTLENLFNDLGIQNTIVPITNVNTKTLEKIIQYCEYHTENENVSSEEHILEWDKKFCDIPLSDLFELILGANYLDIAVLLDQTCRKVAGMIKGKTPEELRTHFNIKNDFTPEEEERIRNENEWYEEQ